MKASLFILTLCFLLSLALPAGAQEESKLELTTPDWSRPRWTRDKPFLLLSIGTHLSTIGDVETTQRFREQILARGLEPGEINPLARPFVANRGQQYAVWNATAAGANWLGWKMKSSPRRWVRRIWWLPQVALTSVNLTATVHNVRGMREFSRRPR